MPLPSADQPRVDGRRTRHAQRRPELLGRAADYVLAHGLGDVSIRPLAAALGISHRAVLHHFGTKEQLLVEAVSEVRRREQQRLRGLAVAADASLEEVLRATWLRISAPEHLPYVRLHFELQLAAERRPAVYGRFTGELVASWIDLIAEWLTGRDAAVDARAVATFIYATTRGLQLDLLATAQRRRVDAGFEELVRAVAAHLPASGARNRPCRDDVAVDGPAPHGS